MPIYAYRCTSCGFEQDVLQKISDAPLTDCPQCHTASLQKKLTAPGFQLKGSGWYATDFRNSGSTPAKGTPANAGDKSAEKGAEKAGSDGAAGAPKSESAPAACAPGCGCH